MSFLIRYTEQNEIHDVIVCIINEKYKVKHVEITDEEIQPNILWIEQTDWVVFDWNTKRKHSIVQIEPFAVETSTNRSIELKTPDEHFFWPNDPTRRGYMLHQFNKTGVFCYKTTNNQIGTIIVEARQTVHQIPVVPDQTIYEMNTNGVVQFNWSMDPSGDKSILFTLDPLSSVPPHVMNGVDGVFKCAAHKCVRADAVIQRYLYTCETLLLNIPQHGLYNFAYSEDPNVPLLSIIVENDIDKHTVVYNEYNVFEPPTLIINRNDQVWFEPSSAAKVETLYETDEFGEELAVDQPVFRPQEKSVNFFMKSFPETGIFYFSTANDQKDEIHPVAIIVLPDVRFHYRTVGKGVFDNKPIITDINDFIFWKFEEIISHNVGYIQSNDRLQDLINCHDRAVQGRYRQCLGVECIQSGTFFFANPDFERVTGSTEERLVATIIVEPHFSQNCFMVGNHDFVPTVLHIAENDTVSWVLASSTQNDQIYVRSVDDDEEVDDSVLVNRNITKFLHNVQHLHTFHKAGEYIVRSNRFQQTATVFVHSEKTIKDQKKRVPPPQFTEELDTISPLGARLHLSCPSRHASIYYTLDGKPPTQRTTNVHRYDDDEGVILNEHGLHVLRACSVEPQRISSITVTSSPTFILDETEREELSKRLDPPPSTYHDQPADVPTPYKVILSSALKHPNKLYGMIEIDPADYMKNIDHFELYINDVAQTERIPTRDTQFSASGFAAGEQYEIYVVAHPKSNAPDGRSIASNKRTFEVQRETQNGAPLISLAISENQNVLTVMWAHIHGPVSEYNIYINDNKTQTVAKKDFNDFYTIRFQDIEHGRKYLIYVEAKMENGKDIRKSNVISITPPIEMTVKEPTKDQFFPYVVTNHEQAPDDVPLENTPSPEPVQRRPDSVRYASEPIAAVVGDAAPTVSYKPNPGGITLFWKKKSPSADSSVENYRIVVDKKQYGELVSPSADPKAQVNLPSGKHECYLEIIPKNKKHEGYTSNILNVEVPPGSGLKYTTKQKSDPSHESVDKAVLEKELPIPKLNVSTISGTAIRANWYGDRPLPAGVFAAINEVHVRGPEFSENIKSDDSSTDEDYIEHIWNVSNSPLEISGILDRHEYLVFVRTYYHVQGSNDTKYMITESNKVKTKRIDPLIELLTRPLLKVTKLGVQMANLSWKLDDTIDPSLVKGYRIILNSKPTEILSATQHEYELRNLKAGSTNEVQVSVTSHPDFVDEKISEPIRIVCPKPPHPPKIHSVISEKPFSIRIQWEADGHENDDITAYRTYLDGKLHGEVENDGRQTFTYDFTKLDADAKYSVHVKSLLGHKRLEGNRYQCDIESNSSNELRLKCAVPPKGTVPRVERMHSNGVDIVWEAPEEYGDVKLTGYQILNNGRSIGKALPVDRRRASINDLEPGQRYSLQVVPITDQPGGVLFRKGEEYDADRHGHYLPSEKLEIDFTDLVQLPKKVWAEQIAGRSALVCWSPIDSSTPAECQPDGYKLIVWNNKDLPRDKPRIVTLSKDQTSTKLKDLQSDTKYDYQLEACKKRRHTKTKDSYNVLTTSEVESFTTGSPPDPPMNAYIIACKNAEVRIGFDPFVEHNAEIKGLRILCEPASAETNAREIVQDFMPDSTEFIITNLTARANYNATIYGITQEYLDDNRCRDVKQLPKKLKPSEWLPCKTFQFQTSGYEPASNINVTQANIEAIKLEWTLAKVYGSTECVQQILRWQLEPGGKEQSLDLDRSTTKATIPGPLISGLYKIYLDTVLSVKINLEDDGDGSDRKETRLTSNTSASVRFHAPGTCEQPEIYLTGYTMNTIDLAWNKPGMFDIVDHPERTNEQLRIHRRLIGYRVDINDRKHNELDEDQRQCVLTDCHPNEEYKIRLVAQTIVQQANMGNMITDGDKKAFEPDETPSKTLSVRTLKNEDFLQSFRANFEFYHDNSMSRSLVDPNNPSPLGKINVEWKIHRSKNISHFILQWRSSKDLRIQEKTVACNETSAIIDACDEKHFYVIDLIIVTNDSNRHQYEQLTVPIPGIPDAPKLWLVKTTDTNFTVEWSEPKSYGIPIIGYELYIEGKRNGDMIEVKSHQIDIPSRINRTYQVNVCAITNHPQRSHSVMSQTLCVITTPTTSLVPTIYYNNDDGNALTLDQNIARIIPVQIESINEERLHVDWTSFLHTPSIRAYYVHYTCLNNGEVQAMKISKRHRHAVLRGLRPGFTYGIMVMAVDKNGAVLYTSDKSTIQMNAPPNAPIVAILERTRTRVKLEWRAPTSYGEFTVVGYKIFVNNRLAAILSHDQLTYTLTNGMPCDVYTVHVQALSSEKNVVSPMSRGVQFTWPGIRAGALRRVDDGQTGAVVVAWEHPQLEDEKEKLISFELFSKNILTNIVQLHGKYEPNTHQATISGLHNGKHTVWLEIQSEHYRVQSRTITVLSGRSLTLSNRTSMIESAKCFNKKQQRFRSPGPNTLSNSFRHTQYS